MVRATPASVFVNENYNIRQCIWPNSPPPTYLPARVPEKHLQLHFTLVTYLTKSNSYLTRRCVLNIVQEPVTLYHVQTNVMKWEKEIQVIETIISVKASFQLFCSLPSKSAQPSILQTVIFCQVNGIFAGICNKDGPKCLNAYFLTFIKIV